MKVYNWEISSVEYISSFKGKNEILDFLMISLSSVFLGTVVLSIFLLYLYFKNKNNFKIVTFRIILAVLLADLTSRFLFKYWFLRMRPQFLFKECHESYCYGFVSSHASDIFAIITIFIFMNKKNVVWTIPLALLVCFSRLFLNDHFPLDLIGGAVLGIISGLCVQRLTASFYYQNEKSLFS